MLSKNQAKFISSLKQKKNREEHGLFVAEGAKIVNEILNSGIVVREIYSSTNFQLSILNPDLTVIRIKQTELKKISSLTTPNEVLAVCEIPKTDFNIFSVGMKLSLVMDTVQDPGNFGTIIRIADWFGIENIICSEETVEVYNPKVIQATMGSITRVKVHYTNLFDFLKQYREEFPDLKIYGALLDGENIYEKKLSKEGLIVIGNESKGISDELLSNITDKIKIPSYSVNADSAESLNAAIATAVICAEFRRN